MNTANRRIEALLFDLGGVVIEVDFHRVFAAWAAHADVDAKHVQTRFAFDEAYKRHETGEISQPEYFAHLRKQLCIEIDDAAFEKGWNAIFGGEIAGIHDLLKKAGGIYELYAFTNTNECHQRYWRSQYRDVLRNFRSIFVSSELGLRKPDNEAFETVCQRMACQPEEIMFFDDSELNVRGAINSGLRAARVCDLSDVSRHLDALGVDAFDFPR